MMNKAYFNPGLKFLSNMLSGEVRSPNLSALADRVNRHALPLFAGFVTVGFLFMLIKNYQLKNRITLKDTKLNELESKCDNLSKLLNKKDSKIKQVKSRCSELSILLGQKDSKIEQLEEYERRVAALESLRSEMQSTFNDVGESISQVDGQNQQLQSMISGEQGLSSEEGISEETQGRIEELIDENDGKIKDLEQQLLESQQNLNVIKARVMSFVIERNSEVEKLQSYCKDLEEEIKNYNEQFTLLLKIIGDQKNMISNIAVIINSQKYSDRFENPLASTV